MNASYQPGQEDEIELLEDIITENKIIIHNDNVNTFDWVIDTLMEVCRHSFEQAEQCALIIHNRGKYAVKRGSYKTLKPMKEAIVERGIDATIE